MEPDYKTLLTQYMALVIDAESISYLDHGNTDRFLDDAQVEQLKAIESAADEVIRIADEALIAPPEC